MINAQIREDGTVKVKIGVVRKIDIQEGIQIQKEYVGIITAVIHLMRNSNYTEDEIEKRLVESINDAFNNEEDICAI